MLENIRYMAIIDNKKLHILFTELSKGMNRPSGSGSGKVH